MYSKVYNLAERFRYLQQKTPHLIVFDPVFGENLCEVPTKEITKHYDPVEALVKLRTAKFRQPLEQKAVMLAEELQKEADIPWSSIGISGSVMAGLFTLQSDIDPLVYGSENCRKAYAALQKCGKTENQYLCRTSERVSAVSISFEDTILSFEVSRGRNSQGLAA
jgi:predicted nucleotidyltransferase